MLRRLLRKFKRLAGFRRAWPGTINQQYFLENKDQTLWGSVNQEDEKAIVELTKRANILSGPIIEIGALFGFTTQLFATYKAPGKKLIGVENFSWNPFAISPEDHRLITLRVLRYVMTHCNTELYDGSSQEFYKTYRGERPSMVFIDAGHTYENVKADIDWARAMNIPVIAGHDYNKLHPGVVRAVDEAFQSDKKVISSVWAHCV